MSIVQKLSREPALVTGVVTAALGLAVLLGVDVSKETIGGVVVLIGAVFALLRYLTTPTSEVVASLPPGEVTAIAGPASDDPNGTPVIVQPMFPDPGPDR